jgi:hypothetical protein
MLILLQGRLPWPVFAIFRVAGDCGRLLQLRLRSI